MRRLVVSVLLLVSVLATGAASATADEPVSPPAASEPPAEPLDAADATAPMTAFTSEGVDDPQCMGSKFNEGAGDVAAARNLLNGYINIATFRTWRMPMKSGKVDLVKLTWREDPFNNDNWAFNLHTLRWAEPLRRVGSASGDEVSDEERAAMRALYTGLLDDWIRNNPRSSPRSKFAWYDMSVGVRSIGLVCATTVIDETSSVGVRVAASMTAHAKALIDPKQYRTSGNHGLHQNMGLLALGCHTENEAWKTLAQSRSLALLKRSVDTQGVTDEGSLLYQQLNYRWYVELRTRLEACGLEPDAYYSNIDKMPDMMAEATQPDGTVVAFGDTSAKSFMQSVSGTGVEYAVTKGASGPKPSVSLFRVFDRGYAYSRTGWFDTQPGANAQSLAAIRFGPGMRYSVHGQQDAGSVSYFALGRQILWQPGVWGGAGGKPRKYVVSNESHNSIDIPAVSYNPSARVYKTVTRSYPETPSRGRRRPDQPQDVGPQGSGLEAHHDPREAGELPDRRRHRDAEEVTHRRAALALRCRPYGQEQQRPHRDFWARVQLGDTVGRLEAQARCREGAQEPDARLAQRDRQQVHQDTNRRGLQEGQDGAPDGHHRAPAQQHERL